MKLGSQKKLVGKILKASPKRVVFDQARLQDIKESITRIDLKTMIREGVARLKPVKSISRFRIRKNKAQKKKGRQKGQGSRKGKATARSPKKEKWMNKIRSQREFIAALRENKSISQETYRMLYKRSKSGFFRSKSHIKLFLKDSDLFLKKEDKK